MEYTLVLGLSYKKYKKSANITLHVNDKFIDTFDLLDNHDPINQEVLSNIDSRWYKHYRREYMVTGDGLCNWRQLPTFFKVYKLKEENLKGSLQISVSNDDSDYTNGFMRNSSLIEFHTIALFPSYLVENNGEKLMKIFLRIDKRYKHMKYWSPDQDENVRSWPCVTKFNVKRESEQHESNNLNHVEDPIGGSFTTNIAIKEKYQLKVLDHGKKNQEKVIDFNDYPIGNSLMLGSLIPLLNIYNEDQRDSHT